MRHEEVVDVPANTCLLRATEYLSENSLLYRIKGNSLIVTLEEDVDFNMSSFDIAAGEGKYTMKRMYRSAEKFTMDFVSHERGCRIQAVYESPRAREIFLSTINCMNKRKPEKKSLQKREEPAIPPAPSPTSPRTQRAIHEPEPKSVSIKPLSGNLVREGVESLREHIDLDLPFTFGEAYQLANTILSGRHNADIKLDWEEFKSAYQEAVNRWAQEEEEHVVLGRERLEKMLPEGTIRCPRCGTLLRRTTIYDEELQSTRDGYRCMKCKRDYFKE
jgi:uncharacterized C2H2 Zn-finger protein